MTVDARVVAAVRAGNAEAFDLVVREYQPRLYRFLFGLVSDAELAEALIGLRLQHDAAALIRSLKALEKGRLKIIRTRPDSNQVLHEIQTWCSNLTMMNLVIDVTEEDNVALGMANLQTAARLCNVNAGLVTVAAVVVEVLDQPKEAKPN